MNEITRDFVQAVISRMKRPSGMRAADKTVVDIVNRVMNVKRLNLLRYLEHPDVLYEKILTKFEKAPTILNALRPAMIFYGNLTQDERQTLGLTRTDTDFVQERYHSLSSQVTALRKQQGYQRSKRVNADVI